MNWVERLVTALAALVKALQPYMPAIAAFIAGKASSVSQSYKESMKYVKKAADAADDMRGTSFVERVQYLERRKRVRGVPGVSSKLPHD